MKLSWTGKLMAAAVGAKVAAEGLRWVANQIPDEEQQPTRYAAPRPAPRPYVKPAPKIYWAGRKCPRCSLALAEGSTDPRHEFTCCGCQTKFFVSDQLVFTTMPLATAYKAVCLNCGVATRVHQTGRFLCKGGLFTSGCGTGGGVVVGNTYNDLKVVYGGWGPNS